jgi:prepilin peptidase CpaA
MHFGLAPAALVGLFMAACAVVDYRTKKIPNWLTVPAAVLGLVYHLAAPQGAGALWSLAGFAVGFCLLLLPWLLGGGGMGDVKMLAALGAWLGPIGILVAFGTGAVLAAFGMILVLATSAVTEGFSATRKRYAAAGAAPAASSPARKARRVLPFAVPMALATWLVLGWMLLKAAGVSGQ